MKDLHTVCTFTDQAEIFMGVSKDIRLILENSSATGVRAQMILKDYFLPLVKKRKLFYKLQIG